ncbi:uncharacterized protein LOC126749264 [Anthonomus grandis grandis]|uniref:uncharacterized protein LOC126749264 n=1 Tax=Anthonomus grandis grandis TaxID=2921223 RepID=UPI0021664F8D|nr:uncharacterized protein LOC126749264 [Anthonomus grandis grandis]
MREQAYSALLQYYKTVDEKATVDTVKNKINNLRSSFRKELKKVNKSKKSGSGSEQVYVPKLWYFKLLMFTSDQETSLKPISNDSDYKHDTEEEISDNEAEHINEEISSPRSTGIDESEDTNTVPTPLTSPQPAVLASNSRCSSKQSILLNTELKLCVTIKEEFGIYLSVIQDQYMTAVF